jgi:predicted nucleotidyltransferase
MTDKSAAAIREFAEKWGWFVKATSFDMTQFELNKDTEQFISDLTALISEHYVSKEGYIALENMLAKTEAALMEQKQLYFKLFEEEINCMYCEAKIRRGSAIILCKECAENTEG